MYFKLTEKSRNKQFSRIIFQNNIEKLHFCAKNITKFNFFKKQNIFSNNQFLKNNSNLSLDQLGF